MRKKEPPSPAMAAQAGPPLSPGALAEALLQKRDALEREIADFRTRKELEFRAYERRLSASVADLGDLKLQGDDDKSKCKDANAAAQHVESASDRRNLSVSHAGKDERVSDETRPQPSPTTPRHDKERELQGLFLPHFIPLLDDPPSNKRPRSSVSRQNTPTGPEIPAQRAGVNSPDPSAFSPRTSPSPTQFNHPPPQLISTSSSATINTLIAPTRPNPEFAFAPSSPGSLSSSAPISPSAIPAHLRPSSSHSQQSQRSSDFDGSSSHLSPQSERPGLHSRTSSSQSEGSTTSLRSSLRKSNSQTRNGDGTSRAKKKSVRISIGNSIMAPSESPIQSRSAYSPPSALEFDASSNFSSSELSSASEYLDLSDDRGRLDARDVKAGKARIDDEGGARRRRKKRVSTPKPLAAIPKVDEAFDYFPPQPLRSPRLPVNPSKGRYFGTELIEPTTPTTPPASKSNPANEVDDFEVDDPLFDGGRLPNRERNRSGSGMDMDEEDLFREEEGDREREDMDVMNGHDLVEDGEDETPDVALPSPSPHASSMPIGIKGPTGWRLNGMGSSLGRG